MVGFVSTMFKSVTFRKNPGNMHVARSPDATQRLSGCAAAPLVERHTAHHPLSVPFALNAHTTATESLWSARNAEDQARQRLHISASKRQKAEEWCWLEHWPDREEESWHRCHARCHSELLHVLPSLLAVIPRQSLSRRIASSLARKRRGERPAAVAPRFVGTLSAAAASRRRSGAFGAAARLLATRLATPVCLRLHDADGAMSAGAAGSAGAGEAHVLLSYMCGDLLCGLEWDWRCAGGK